MSRDAQSMERTFRTAARPDVALITNHGYGGARVPVGGAPDTGGQNLYVNSLAIALDRLGHRVTIFARGGFPYFGEERVREGSEYLSDHVRYVFVPGGGETFIRKEEIAVALDEQTDWLAEFIGKEAAERGVEPWDVYGLIGTHYWDAAVLASRLVERWRDTVAGRAIAGLLQDAAPQGSLEHLAPSGIAPVQQLGASLLAGHGSASDPLDGRIGNAAAAWARARQLPDGAAGELAAHVEQALAARRDSLAPGLEVLLAEEVLGQALLDRCPVEREALEASLAVVDRHVWTPHSLGDLKDENLRDKPAEVRRELRFCERRSHERMVCDRTRRFAATSLEIADRLRTRYDVSTDSMFYFPPCVDGDLFRPYGGDETAATWRYLAGLSGVSEQRLRASKIVFETSRMDGAKRKDLLLEAFGRVARSREETYLFIGGGPNNAIFEELERVRQADDTLVRRAFLTGFIPDEHMGPLFSIAAVYASPSEMEGFGMSVAQAAASRTAILTTELTPFAVQYVPDAALIVSPGSVAQLARGLETLLADDAGRERRASALAEKAAELDWERQTAMFLDWLRRSGIALVRGARES